MSRKDKKSKKTAEVIKDSYDESSRIVTDEEAHRDVVYELPSYFRQVGECFMIQMKRYTKQKVMWFAIILLALMPILFFLFEKVDSLRGMLPVTEVTNIYIVSLLQFMPVIVPLLAAIACGSMLSQEFNERTVYLSLPLPMPRSAFFFGKFLAALVLIEGVLTAAYGIAMVLAMTVTERTYTPEIFGSMLVMMVYVFFCCSLTYMMSTKLKRGSTMLPFIVLTVALPVVSIVLAQFATVDIMASVASYIPTFSPEMAMYCLGDTTPFSLYGMLSLFAPIKAVPGKNTAVMMVVSLLLGIVLLIVGKKVVEGRDM